MNPNLNAEEFAGEARAISEEHDEQMGHCVHCGPTSREIDRRTAGHLRFTPGQYRGPGSEGGTPHQWVTDLRGTILDATHDQFGEEKVRTVPLYAAQQQEYHHIDPQTDESIGPNPYFTPRRVRPWKEWDVESGDVYEPLWT